MPKSKKKSKEKPSQFASHKEERLFNNILKVTQQFMTGKGYSPLTPSELYQRLSLVEQHQHIFQIVIDTLIRDGIIELSHGRYIVTNSRNEVMTGVVRMHPRGFGFVQADDPIKYPQDVFIPKHFTQNAVDGDRVEVIVNQEVSEKGPEGKIITILNRGRTHIAGIIREITKHGEILAYVPLLGSAQRVVVEPSREFNLKVGDRVVMEVQDWGDKETETFTRVHHYLGHISDPSCDIKAAIEEYELRADFPRAAVSQAQEYGKQVSRKEISQREDLRDIECFTIDPDTAKDFDDAINLSKDEKGHYHLGVHIADVSHYVKSGTPLDIEASQRCNSTYFPGFCLPMLPRELSDNLCSLKPEVNRLTISILIDFDSAGNEINYRITRSVIRSAKRFTYKEAKQVLDGKKKSVHKPTLELMVELCGLLKKKRYERGSIEFAMPELVVLVDDKGMPQKTDYIEYDITHQLVEEFMLKANETVAMHLAKMGKNLTYRIHDEPAEENLKDFSLLAGAFGYRLSEKPTPRELQMLFDEALKTPYGQYLSTSYIRRMRLAVYSPDNIGHYGLGLTHYCHFTSPIRRYVDLVVHRILFGESDERETLDRIATQCSEQERISAKAEGSVVLLKKLRLLDEMRKKDPQRQYEAIVTRVKNFGVYFEVLELMLESFLHVSELDDDYYVYDEAKMNLRGRSTGQHFLAGDRMTVMLKDINFITLESTWSFVSVDGRESEIVQPKRRGLPKGKANSKARRPFHSPRQPKQKGRRRKK